MAIFPDLNLTSGHLLPEFVGDTAQNLSGTNPSVVGLFILGVVLIISFIATMNRSGFENAFAFSTFFGAIISYFLVKLNLLTSPILIVMIALFLISLLILFTSSRE